MLTLLAVIAFILAAILACTTTASRWWPVALSLGLALLAFAHGVDLD
jgi:hypothetical protein